MRKTTLLGILVLAFALALGSAIVSNLVRLDAPTPPTRSIGVLLPLSGALAEFGEAARNGILLATAEHPERFRSIRFAFEDTQYDAGTSIAAFNRMATRDDVVLIYNWGTATGQALAPIAEARKIPLITNTQTPGVSEQRAYVVRFMNPAADFSKAILEALRSRGYRRFGIVKTELAYIDDLLAGIENNLAKGETLRVVDSYQPSDQDFRSTVAKLKSEHFDAVGVFLISGQISQFYRQMKAQELTVSTFGSDFFESESEIEQSGPAIEGAIYSNIAVSDRFREAYRDHYGTDTHVTYASNAYDFAMLTAEILGRGVEATDARELLLEYQQSKYRSGTAGPYGFVESPTTDKYFAFPVGVKAIANGKIHVIAGNSRS
ncbi:MAG: ABC transporter substrate-binding protein [Bdellovibrionales bacterium]|nr:ABC transporter substrate-binding protein [Bdellovibrionales bacterium]